jgi:catechol 2,3-dioxygenase-like lactoylglutathione lyase family enzyme
VEDGVFDHISFPVGDNERSKGFYLRSLAPLGYGLVLEVTSDETGGQRAAGFGKNGHPQFWIASGTPVVGKMHIAFVAKTRAAVEEFYKTALSAGGRDNGAPGLRPHYHENYYGAFIFDPDGNNIEAVCHLPHSR